MTAPKLEDWKFWIVKPKAAVNQIKNPSFAGPEYVTGWAASGAGVTIASHPDDARRGAYSLKVNTANNQASGAYNSSMSVVSGLPYTFSVDVKGVAGQAMRITISNAAGTVKATTTFVATGYWQREEVTHTAAETIGTYRCVVLRDAVASTAAYYIDGAQFEQASKATTFIEGYLSGCRWTGTARNSPSERSAFNGLGGELIDISTYAKIISVQGLGNGDWNQILTKMTSGGDMYQTHIRKSRNFSMVLAYHGDNQGDLQANRKVIIDALRPDYLFGGTDERRIIRYQGFAANGDEATQPVDIVCVPQPSHQDTPSMPVFQKDILSFTIPSGLLQGAYNEGRDLDLYANFPAEFIVKRDKDGNWCTWDGTNGTSLIAGLNGTVYCMAEGPDGKIYIGGNFTNAGGVTAADYLARWNPISGAWEAVVSGINNTVYCMAFDANGDLYVGGIFANLGSAYGNCIAKITSLTGTPAVSALGTGLNQFCWTIDIAPNGDVYAAGNFTAAGGVANTSHIAKWNGTAWSALATGLDAWVYSLAFSPNGTLYIGGNFDNADGTNGDHLCYWDGSAFHQVGSVEITNTVYKVTFDEKGKLIIGGSFTNAGGVANADYIACWNGAQWESFGTGTNGSVRTIVIKSGKYYVAGGFTTAGGLTLTDRNAVWSNGSWQPFDINLPGNGAVYSILPTSDGSLYIGGDFSTAGETPDVNAFTGVVALNLNVASASANTYPFIQVHGPGTLKAITNYSTGKTIAFDGLTLQTGEWINLFFDPLNLKFQGGWSGRGNLMRYVVPGSDYGDFYLKPGNNLISLFYPDSDPDLGSCAFISWNPQFWGLDGALL